MEGKPKSQQRTLAMGGDTSERCGVWSGTNEGKTSLIYGSKPTQHPPITVAALWPVERDEGWTNQRTGFIRQTFLYNFFSKQIDVYELTRSAGCKGSRDWSALSPRYMPLNYLVHSRFMQHYWPMIYIIVYHWSVLFITGTNCLSLALHCIYRHYKCLALYRMFVQCFKHCSICTGIVLCSVSSTDQLFCALFQALFITSKVAFSIANFFVTSLFYGITRFISHSVYIST